MVGMELDRSLASGDLVMPVYRRPRTIRNWSEPTGPSDRRYQPRYWPVVKRARIGWWEDIDFQAARARLIDIALGGAAAVSRTPPPPDQVVYLRLSDRRLPTESVPARVVYRGEPGSGLYLLGLAFDRPCPPALFEAATCGFDALRSILN
jgi:hypothetical protein